MNQSLPLANDRTIYNIFTTFAKANPHPVGELNYSNTYTLLVAVVLSAQATDVSVNKATAKLFAIANEPEKMLQLGKEKLIEHIRHIGLFRGKAKNIIGLSQMLIEEYNGKVPCELDLLEKLPGVGRKSASVVANTAYGKNFIAVDTHVFRLSHRLELANGKNPDQVQKVLEKRIPEKFRMNAHQWLILHGRYVCKARKPLCNICIITKWCNSTDKTDNT